jgi:WD40 repeat protein
MLRRLIEKLDDRCVPAATNPAAPTPESTGTPSDTAVVDSTDPTAGETETTDETVQTTSTPQPTVTLGEGNTEPLGVASKFVLVSGLRDGTARLYSFSKAGQLVDTGRSFTPFAPTNNRQTAIRGTVGDFNGDGTADFAFVRAGGATTTMRVIDGKTNQDLVSATPVYGEFFRGGAHVSATDFDGDGRDEIVVTPDASGGPRVRIFSIDADGNLATRADYFAIDDTGNRGGLRTAGGDINGDGTNDLVLTHSGTDSARITAYDGKSFAEGVSPTRMIDNLAARLISGDEASMAIARVAGTISISVGDLNADGFADITLGSAVGAGSMVTTFDGKALLTDAAAAQANPLNNTTSGNGGILRVTGFRRAQLANAPTDPLSTTNLDPFASVTNVSKLVTTVTVG